MMAAGLEKQLLRCNSTQGTAPSFCGESSVYTNVKTAYNNLWNSIEANANLLRTEVWSWVYNNGFKYTPLGALPAPDGSAQTESDIVQVNLSASYTDLKVVEFDVELCGFAKPKIEVGSALILGKEVIGIQKLLSFIRIPVFFIENTCSNPLPHTIH